VNIVNKKLRIINPKLKQKLKKPGIIFPIRNSEWLSNLVIVRKKSGEIILCVDFRDLNRVSIKDNYSLPNMEILLQEVIFSTLMSILDGFFGYNHMLVAKKYRPKTTFLTPWETYAYVRMNFGLRNVGETFQREMDHAFKYVLENSWLSIRMILPFTQSLDKNISNM